MLWFRLAGHLKKTVEELQTTMSRREFEAWAAFDMVDPIGARGDSLRMAYALWYIAKPHWQGLAYENLVPEFLLPEEIKERVIAAARFEDMKVNAYLARMDAPGSPWEITYSYGPDTVVQGEGKGDEQSPRT